jgi:hypothetical protein
MALLVAALAPVGALGKECPHAQPLVFRFPCRSPIVASASKNKARTAATVRLLFIGKKSERRRKPLMHLKFPKNPLFTTCGHYRQTKTRGQAGFEDFFFICQTLTKIFETKIPVENSVDN